MSEQKKRFSLAAPFQDGMIVAKNHPIRVFGEGSSDVTAELCGKTAAAQPRGNGWLAELPPPPAGGPYTMEVRHAGGAVQIHDVHVGIVVLASGQSNMQFRLKESNSPMSVRQDDALLRSFSLPRMEDGEPYSPDDGWVKATADNAANWSAIGYLLGRELRERTGEAVGIVNCYQGASVIETWLPKELSQKPAYQLPIEDLHWDHVAPLYSKWNKWGLLYELDILPFAPFSLSHVVWYQGESNTGKGDSVIYPQLAVELVNAWRNAFQNATLPFTMVQIADFAPRNDEHWKKVQAGQLSIPSLTDGVKVVKSADVCETDAIHPPSKAALSHRLAESILSK